MRLADVAARVTGVTWSGDSQFTARCPAHADESPSLSVGVGERGAILINCFAGCDPTAIASAMGLKMADLMPPKLSLASGGCGGAPSYLKLWKESIPAIGTLAESYLRARGLTLPIPPSLHFLPDALYHEGEQRERLPMMIAPIQIDRTIIGVHRTYLAADGLGKASVAKPKKMLGGAKGGAVRLGPHAERIGIAEGIETALAAMQGDLIPVWAALSTVGMKEVIIPADTKEVVIYADADEPGLLAARALAQRLILSNIRVGIKRPAAGKDFNDLLSEGGDSAIRDIPIEWQDPAVDKSLPIIDAENGDLWSTLNAIADAIKKWNDPPRLFVQETTGRLVKLVWRMPKKDEPDTGQAAYLSLDEVTLDGYRNIMAAAARWVKYRKSGAEPCYPRSDTIHSAYDHAKEGRFLPPLRAVVYAPACAPSGRFLKAGYDAETRLWYSPDDGDPSDDEIDDEDPEALQAAISWFEEAVCDFLFESPGDKAHALSLFLLPFVRELIDGPIPLYNIEAPIAGTGKGLLSRVLLRPSNSYRMIPETRREDEQEKQITAACANAWPAAVIDNVSNVVNSPLLASIVTSKNPELRMMGGYKMIKVMRVPIFIITANNPTFSEENARRVARIRITSPIEQPADREGFKHQHLELWTEENRAELCRAAVTIVAHWLKNGRPGVPAKPWGSFERWADVMGSLAAFAGFTGFGTARIEKEAVDSSESRWRELIEKWAELYGTQPVTAASIVTAAEAIDGFFSEREKLSKARVIGNGLRARRDRIFGLYKIKLGATVQGQRRWELAQFGN